MYSIDGCMREFFPLFKHNPYSFKVISTFSSVSRCSSPLHPVMWILSIHVTQGSPCTIFYICWTIVEAETIPNNRWLCMWQIQFCELLSTGQCGKEIFSFQHCILIHLAYRNWVNGDFIITTSTPCPIKLGHDYNCVQANHCNCSCKNALLCWPNLIFHF